MTSAQVNPTPKDRFLASDDNIKKHHALLENPAYDRAEDLALLSYARSISLELSNSQNPQVQSLINGFKMQGAQEFIHVFRTLAEKPAEVKAPGLARTLDHKN